MLRLKNKTEREAFVTGYRNWTDGKGRTLGVWQSVPELELSFYRYPFANGGVLMVTEYQEYKMVCKDYRAAGREFTTNHRYCLILPNDDYINHSSAVGSAYYRTFTLDGCSLGTVVDYMTKNKMII